MAINSVMKPALKALSYPDLDIKKHYKLVRAVSNTAHFSLPDPSYQTWDHEVTCGDHKVPVRVYIPGEETEKKAFKVRRPVLIFFHGGGWIHGNINSYDKFCRNLSQSTAHTVVSVDYQLAPEHPYPAALHDCYAVVREVMNNAGLLNTTPDEVTLIGDSAGGNLAAAVSLMARDLGEFLPKRQILIYPAVAADHDPATSPYHSIRENGTDYLLTAKRICDYFDLYLGTDGKRASAGNDPYIAPLLAGDFTDQPDTLIITAEYDPLRDEGEDYGRRLLAAGNYAEIFRVSDALHGFATLPVSFPQVGQCFDRIRRFLEEGRGIVEDE